MSEKELEEMEFRARHAVEPWRPEANYVGRLKEDLHRLIAEVRGCWLENERLLARQTPHPMGGIPIPVEPFK